MIKDTKLIDPLFEPKELQPSRSGFGKALVALGEKNSDIWVLTADVSESTRTHWFSEKFPKRFVQVGVAEQNLAGVAAGIASCGKTAFMSAYAVFSPGRNWDQIRVSICYNNVNVKMHASHSGLTVGPDGASHQALEDIAMMRALPNVKLVVPADYHEAYKATFAAAETNGPVYIRSCRGNMPVFTTPENPFRIGEANVCRDGSDVAIFACGPLVYESLKAAEELKKGGIDAAVVNLHTIKPMDRDAVIEYAKKTGLIVSVEEHQVYGGMGSAIAEVLSQEYPTPLKIHGVYDKFCESGSASELLHKYRFDAEGIAKVVTDSMKMKKR